MQIISKVRAERIKNILVLIAKSNVCITIKNEELIEVFDEVYIRQNDNEKITTIALTNKRLLFLGFFFRYGLCIIAILVPFIFIIIGDILNKKMGELREHCSSPKSYSVKNYCKVTSCLIRCHDNTLILASMNDSVSSGLTGSGIIASGS